jgi:hypothetical protein
MSNPLIVAYGAGTNSTAMLLEFVRRDENPDLILFADTGGEKPETYNYLWTVMHPWCEQHGLTITVVRWYSQKWKTLEEQCLVTRRMPSKAFGFPSCSVRWKIEPQQREVKRRYGKQTVQWCIGIHAGENRKLATDTDLYQYRYPLREWDYDQDECERIIHEAGLPVPPKSACFFCPNSKKSEIIALKAQHPNLMTRALAIESGGQWESDAIKGLGRRFSWRNLIEADSAQLRLFPSEIEDDCMCVDGE